MSTPSSKKLYKIIELTPDLDSVNVTGKISNLQLMESSDGCGNNIVVANFDIVDETASVKSQLTGLGKISNGDVVKIKNGRMDIINNKLVLANDIWTKATFSMDTSSESMNSAINISEIQYKSRAKPIVPNKEEGELK